MGLAMRGRAPGARKRSIRSFACGKLPDQELEMDLVLGQAPAVAAASSAAEAAASATQAAASAAEAAANAASIGFTAGDSVINDGGQLEIALPSISKSANYSVLAQDRGKVIACTAGGITITLPSWSEVGNGFVVGIRNNIVG